MSDNCIHGLQPGKCPQCEARRAPHSYSYTGSLCATDITAELARLREVELAALRVASSVRDGVCLDRGALKLLDAALESDGAPERRLTVVTP